MEKTIVRLDTNNLEKINEFKAAWEASDTVFIPKSDSVQVFIVDSNGKVTQIKSKEEKSK